LAAAAVAVLVGGTARLGRQVDAEGLSLDECRRGGTRCVGETLQVGYMKVLRIEGGVVVVREAGQFFELHGLDVEGLRVGIDEVSVIATWTAAGDLQVHEALRHPHRNLKKAASAAGLFAWFGLLLRRRRG
jgi:hypothetical protein